MQANVSHVIVSFLERLGIDIVYGMPGAHVLPLYDRLRDSRLRTVLAKHEQGAAFMAGGQARVSHRPAGCIATSGPGATNLITGIANAYAERLPVLAITGETSTYIFGKGGLQESSGEGGAIDQGSLFAGITRYHKRIERTDYLAQVLNQATRALFAPEPGPVLLSIPYNVQKEPADLALLEEVHLSSTLCQGAHPPPDAGALDELARMLGGARAPVVIAGHGCIRAGARDLVAQLSRRLGIPVATSLKAKGVVSEDGPLALGCLGVTSDGAAYQHIAEHADLVVFLGASFNERTSYLWDAKLLHGKRLVQVDLDADRLGRVFRPDLAILGDLREVLSGLLARLDSGTPTPAPIPHPRAPARPARALGDERFRVMAAFFAGLAARFPARAMVFDDNIVFAQSHFDVSDANHYFPNTGISSLGYALPAAIGARLHARLEGRDAPTFAIMGDGGFQMCGMEIMTAVNYAIPLNVVVINNGSMSLIRKNQFQLYGGRYIDCDFVNPDFALLAQAFGIHHHRVETEADVATLFAHADLEGAINLIEIPLDKHAFPAYLSNR